MAIPLVAGPGSIRQSRRFCEGKRFANANGVTIGLATKMIHWSDYVGSAIGIVLFGG